MMNTTETIGERFPNCHNPALKWIPGHAETLRIESALTPNDEGVETVCEFAHVFDFCDCAGECSPDTELTDAEWLDILTGMVETPCEAANGKEG